MQNMLLGKGVWLICGWSMAGVILECGWCMAEVWLLCDWSVAKLKTIRKEKNTG